MAKVRYVQGKKASYLAIDKYDPLALYFCTDTDELFKGDRLYSDGVRIVLNYESLPAFEVAADGILYYCKSSGCGYVLNEERNGWLCVVYGFDNETIGVNSSGLISVESVPIAKVSGLQDELQRIEAIAISSNTIASVEKAGIVKPGSEIAVAEDGTMSLVAVEISKITGLEDRLKTVVEKPELQRTAKMVAYEVSNKPDGTLVNYTDEEVRVMCPADTEWKKQNSGENADANMYYIGFRAYAPDDSVVSFKEDLKETISDSTMYYFENNEFAGIDEFGRKYSVVWLPVAAYNESTGTWSYYGEQSSDKGYIGWYYSVEWYNAAGMKVAADTIRVNLANENCYTNLAPFYIADLKTAVSDLQNSTSWEDM